MVSLSHTIADPWAMMIHFENTFTANTAVMCSGRLNELTFLTISEWNHTVSKVIEISEHSILLVKRLMDSVISYMIQL